MSTFFEVKIKSLKIDQIGFERNVTDTILIDAVSYTEAEARAYKIAGETTRGEFKIVGIRETNITEVINGGLDKFWKVKVVMNTIDEVTGREKKGTFYMLVGGDDIQNVINDSYQALSYLLVPYEIVSVALSTIIEVHPFIKQDGDDNSN